MTTMLRDRRSTRLRGSCARAAAHGWRQLEIRAIRSLATGRDRGDVPGWVLVTLMTAGLVVALWAIAGPLLGDLFRQAVTGVTGP
jgi:hypothetical protein